VRASAVRPGGRGHCACVGAASAWLQLWPGRCCWTTAGPLYVARRQWPRAGLLCLLAPRMLLHCRLWPRHVCAVPRSGQHRPPACRVDWPVALARLRGCVPTPGRCHDHRCRVNASPIPMCHRICASVATVWSSGPGRSGDATRLCLVGPRLSTPVSPARYGHPFKCIAPSLHVASPGRTRSCCPPIGAAILIRSARSGAHPPSHAMRWTAALSAFLHLALSYFESTYLAIGVTTGRGVIWRSWKDGA
jgi:hypothetical protein